MSDVLNFREVAPDTAGHVLIAAPNWRPGQCVICGGRRTWADVGSAGANPTCDGLVCRMTMSDKDLTMFHKIQARRARKQR
jgi:hypothetical protein